MILSNATHLTTIVLPTIKLMVSVEDQEIEKCC